MTDLLDGSEYWRDHAACSGSSANLFYPVKDDHAAIRLAKLTCKSCPVAIHCLSAALENGEPDGIWGGYTTEEREIIRVANQWPKKTPPTIFPHGTEAGHMRHRRAGTRPCRPCVEANLRKRRDRKTDKGNGD
jgi:WhiB family redox-sensing transcriptional regulator